MWYDFKRLKTDEWYKNYSQRMGYKIFIFYVILTPVAITVSIMLDAPLAAQIISVIAVIGIATYFLLSRDSQLSGKILDFFSQLRTKNK